MIFKKISPAVFGLIIICFFLPWVNVSCQNYKIATLTGINFVTGTTLETPQEFKSPIFGYQQNIPKSKDKSGKIPSEIYAILAFICAVGGLALSFIKGKLGSLANILAASGGIIFTILLKFKIERELVQKSQGLIQLDYSLGFYLTLLLFALAVLLNILYISKGESVSATSTKISPDYKFCPQCGTKNEKDNAFCKECGTKLP